MSVMLKKKGVLMRCARPTVVVPCLVDLAAALQESWSAYSAERMTAVWRGLFASKALLKHAVETHRSHCPRFLQAPK